MVLKIIGLIVVKHNAEGARAHMGAHGSADLPQFGGG